MLHFGATVDEFLVSYEEDAAIAQVSDADGIALNEGE